MTQPATRPARPFAVTRNLRLLYTLGTLTMAQPGLAIWVVYLLDFRGLTLTQVGVMEAFFWGVKLLIEVPSGAVADRFGRRATFWIGLIIEGSGVAMFAFASSFPILLVSYVLWSSGLSFRSGNDQAYLYDTLASGHRSEEFSERTGIYGALTTAAFTISGIAGAWLASLTTLQVPMVLGIVPFISAAVCLAFMQEPPRVLGTQGHLPYAETLRTAWDVLRRNRLVRYAVLTQIFVTTALGASFLLVQPFLQEHRVDIGLFGLLQAPAAMAGAGASILSARLARALGVLRLGWLTLLLTIGGLLVVAAIDHVLAFAGIVAVQIAIGAATPAITGYVNDRTDSNIRATMMSVVPLGTSLTWALTGPFAGTLGDASLPLAFGAMAAVILASAGASLLLWQRAERATPVAA